ncbi:MAG: response regulator transcription factor [Ekhidna sp.]|uniref:response regulator transcription factor n=1 Tax=Ekhidna sp. TaxID=2608089 RepID=UPI0032EEADC4
MSQPNKLNILVTDDHTLFRRGTMMLLESFEEVAEVDDAENGKEALEKLSTENFHLILLDLEMPVMDGWETAKKIVSKHPDVKIIMISMHDSLQIISDLIEIGVHSYLLKNAEPDEVHKAILSVVNNDFYYNHLVSKALHKKVQKDGIDRGVARRADVSPREIEILQLICQELTMKEIGEKLYLSEQTVHTHRKNLMKKTKAKNAVGLVKFAFQNGIAGF